MSNEVEELMRKLCALRALEQIEAQQYRINNLYCDAMSSIKYQLGQVENIKCHFEILLDTQISLLKEKLSKIEGEYEEFKRLSEQY